MIHARAGASRGARPAARRGRAEAWQDARVRAVDFPVKRVAAARRGRTVSVVIPARDEAATVGGVVGAIRSSLMGPTRVVDEVVVVDDGSTDATAEVAADAGATVVRAGEVLPEVAGAGHPGGQGKGQALWRGVHVSSGDVVAFCDADIRDFDPAMVLGVVGPLLCPAAAGAPAFVKGFYERPLQGRPGEGGRVTELAARPLVALLFPHLSGIVQPLAGEFAGWREVLEAVPFVGGYGVDLGLLVDIAHRWGVDAIAQCDLGVRVHRNRPLAELGPQALAIWQLGLQRAGLAEGADLRAVLEPPGADPVAVAFSELPPLASIGAGRRSA
ncbi:MAG TPA: glucosyl-3-phosphoglycerate synthase [Acidimicrobiales bacterium]|nr:glucosyl-3-phosphoglycerate synthase [Acidimicrobiales bacterium]